MPSNDMKQAASFVEDGKRHIQYEGSLGAYEAVIDREDGTVQIQEKGSSVIRRYPIKLMQYIGVMVTPDYMLKNRGPVDA